MVEPRQVWEKLLDTMALDNDCTFRPTEEDFAKAEPAIVKLVQAGYFLDDPDDLNGSFWQAATGEQNLRADFFSRDHEAFVVLDKVLDTVFERG